jgi:hypothetical protein
MPDVLDYSTPPSPLPPDDTSPKMIVLAWALASCVFWSVFNLMFNDGSFSKILAWSLCNSVGLPMSMVTGRGSDELWTIGVPFRVAVFCISWAVVLKVATSRPGREFGVAWHIAAALLWNLVGLWEFTMRWN